MSNLQRIIWLASFPKSGNTWMRVLLANYFLPPDQVPDINALHRFTTADVRQDFFDRAAGRPFRAASVQEWLAMRPKVLQAIAGSKPGHHFVKTHSKLDRVEGVDLIQPGVTAAALYMMRNPFDLALSYSRHLGESVDRTIEIMQDRRAMAGSPTGIYEFIGRWDDHIAGWAGARGLAPHVLRYEDMLTDTEAALRGVLDFLKTPVDQAALQRAVKAASFDNLRKQEETKGFKERPAAMQRFFATGTSGGWREKLTPAQVRALRRGFVSTLKKHYPEMLDETADLAARA